MIGGTASADLARDISALSRRNRSALIQATFGSASIPTDTLSFVSGTTYRFFPETYWWNEANDIVTDTDRAYKHDFILHAASGTPNNKLIIYIHGHEGDDWDAGNSQSQAATDIAIIKAAFPDYDVLETWLIGYREQTASGVYAVRSSPINFNDIAGHTRLCNSLPGLVGRLFTWPYIAAVNHFIGTYNAIYITGHSGGADMALWIGAMDTRISGTFPLAGMPGDWFPVSSDGESNWMPALSAASHLGQMALASENWCRSVWNRNDAVRGMGTTDIATVETAVQAVSPNYRTSDIDGPAAHGLVSTYLADIITDLAAL